MRSLSSCGTATPFCAASISALPGCADWTNNSLVGKPTPTCHLEVCLDDQLPQAVAGLVDYYFEYIGGVLATLGRVSACFPIGIVYPSKVPESGGRRFRRDIPLWAGQHFVADHELTDRRRPQQRRIEVRVEMPFRVRLAIGRGLMKAHRIGERNLEEIVVARGELFEDIRK